MFANLHNPKPIIVRFLALALVFSACLPQGYMLERSADNVVEIVLCRGLGEETEVLLLDVDSGQYLEQSHSSSVPHEAGPCDFAVTSFDLATTHQNIFADNPQSTRFESNLIAKTYLESEYLTPLSRAPPMLFVS